MWPVLMICGATALATALMTLFAGRNRRTAPPSVLGLLGRAAATGAAAVFVGSIIAAVHAPSGH